MGPLPVKIRYARVRPPSCALMAARLSNARQRQQVDAEVGGESVEQRLRQPDDVGVIALDPGGEDGEEAVDAVSPPLVARLAGGDVPRDPSFGGCRPTPPLARSTPAATRPTTPESTAAPVSTSCSRPARRRSIRAASASSAGLAKMTPSAAS